MSGICYGRLKQPSEEGNSLERALQTCDRHVVAVPELRTVRIDTLNAIALRQLRHDDEGGGRDAIGTLEKARDAAAALLAEGAGDGRAERCEAVTLTNLGHAYQRSGRTREALDVSTRALALKKRLGATSGELGRTTMNIAGLNRESGNAQEALKLYEEVVGAAAEAGEVELRMAALLNIANLRSGV